MRQVEPIKYQHPIGRTDKGQSVIRHPWAESDPRVVTSFLLADDSTIVPAQIRIVVRNPQSGDGVRTNLARDLALQRDYEVLDTQSSDHTIELAAEAAERGEVVIACGGDGTLNDTVQGVRQAGRLSDVSLGVIPAGTGNDFADNIGIRGVRHAFDVIETGNERTLDLGLANGLPFLNSCVGGLTAEASARTSSALKRRLGVLAYVLTTFATIRDFDTLELHVLAGPERDPVWTGDALMLLIGNGRRFPGERKQQANMEDGLLNVVVIEHLPTLNYLSRGAADRLLRRGAKYLTRMNVSHLHVTHTGEPAKFSLDGSMIATNELTADSEPGAMRFLVGSSYTPNPGP